MNILLLYPKFPPSNWSFEALLQLIGRKALMPPLGLITVAALLPQEWNFRLVDCNIDELESEDWEWADLVLLSGMIAQKQHLLELVREAKTRNRAVAVGGPYPTSVPNEALEAGADFLVLDEGEITIPLFVEALNKGDRSGIFRAGDEKADMSLSPIPRFDLLKLNDYSEMALQITRGCPFLCEFCDIIILWGRKPRSKSPRQVLAELKALYDLGWRRSVFFVDDNFIGNKRQAKMLLKAITEWQTEHQFPFTLNTEASVNLADDPELLELMTEANFRVIFVGIETPDVDSLKLTKKTQNTRKPLHEQIETLTKAGFRVIGGFIIGFDGEQPGADQRIIDFVQETGIPMVMVSMLQALPDTHLMNRLRKEGRVVEGNRLAGGLQSNLLNFIPTRPLQQIAEEQVNCNWQLYDAKNFFERSYKNCLMRGSGKRNQHRRQLQLRDLGELSAVFKIIWRNGFLRPTRGVFWGFLLRILQNNPAVLRKFLVNCAQYEHFFQYREHIRDEVHSQLAQLSEQELQQHVTLKKLEA